MHAGITHQRQGQAFSNTQVCLAIRSVQKAAECAMFGCELQGPPFYDTGQGSATVSARTNPCRVPIHVCHFLC